MEEVLVFVPGAKGVYPEPPTIIAPAESAAVPADSAAVADTSAGAGAAPPKPAGGTP